MTSWISELQAGDDSAAGLLWDRYFDALVEIACAKLRRSRHPGAAHDAEDAALSALDSFVLRARQGRFTSLRGRDELRRLLVAITLRKAADRIDLRLRQKRGSGKILGEADIKSREPGGERVRLDQFAGSEPSPDVAAAVQEGFDQLLEALEDETLRAVAQAALAGYTDQELAQELRCSRRTITNKLKLIRLIWEDEP